uniref:Secreted protein n=1 Tax=Anopheles darlingi TaxID=43151 RepID=A0A2M4D3E7_ANODA
MAFITAFIVLTFVVPRSYLSPLGVAPSPRVWTDFFFLHETPASWGREEPLYVVFFCSSGSCFLHCERHALRCGIILITAALFSFPLFCLRSTSARERLKWSWTR